MARILLFTAFIILTLNIYSQSLEAEKEAINTSLVSGEINGDQANQLIKKWNNFIAPYRYPVFKVDTSSNEPDFTEILTFTSHDKKINFQRCLQWMALSYFDLTYSDLESGKIIGNGQMDLAHYEEFPTGFGSKSARQIQTTMNYTLILTFKESKVKYSIKNIFYTFNNFSETIDIITYPVSAIYPIVLKDQLLWLKYLTLLKETEKKFRVTLKDSLVEYVYYSKEDFNF